MADRMSRGHRALSWIHVVVHGFTRRRLHDSENDRFLPDGWRQCFSLETGRAVLLRPLNGWASMWGISGVASGGEAP